MGIEPSYTEEELKALDITLPNYVGYETESAKAKIEKLGVKCEIVGDGEKVEYTIPAAGSKFSKSSGKVILVTDSENKVKTATVPNVMGKKGSSANQMLINAGFNIEISGALNYESGQGAVVVSQSVAPGTKLEIGSVIKIELRHLDSHD
jgi:beta-lactam-binding protein with PASTA domain